MRGGITREEIRRIRRRHRGYNIVLATISLLLLLQPLAQHWPLLNPLGAITLALVMMVFLTRYSPLRARRKVFYALGIAAVGSELVWLLGLFTDPGLAIHLGIVHLLIWSLFIGVFLLRKVRALMLEPFVTQAVVMGAASAADRLSRRLPAAYASALAAGRFLPRPAGPWHQSDRGTAARLPVDGDGLLRRPHLHRRRDRPPRGGACRHRLHGDHDRGPALCDGADRPDPGPLSPAELLSGGQDAAAPQTAVIRMQKQDES
jgi:hypothetical protein